MLNPKSLLTVLAFANVLNWPIAGQSQEFTNYVCLFSFDGTNGADPYGDLIEGMDGRLYGVTVDGGLTNATFPQGMGIVFSLNKNGSGFTLLHCFGEGVNDGQEPSAALMEDRANGMLYGTTMYGGMSSAGTIFRLNKDGSGYSVIKSFSGGDTDGGNPQGGLLKASDGALYGTASIGGGGLIFKTDECGSNYTVISSLADSVGNIVDLPTGSLIEGTNGVLYGAGRSGWMPDDGGEDSTHGALFQVNKDGSGLAVDSVAFFSDEAGGCPVQPNGPLLDIGDGFIYGTTESGETPQGGCVFCFSTGEFWNFTVLSGLSTLGGPLFQPCGGLIEGPDGDLYGTASSQYPHLLELGQPLTYGGVFTLATDGNNFTVLKVFYSSPDGATPQGRLLLASDGGMYGVTSAGGTAGYGTIFALYPDIRSWFTSMTYSNNNLSLDGLGAAGSAFRLQCAGSLSSSIWKDACTNTATITGALTFTNVSTEGTCRFFRLVTP